MRRVTGLLLVVELATLSCTSDSAGEAAGEPSPGSPVAVSAEPEPTPTTVAGSGDSTPGDEARTRFAGRVLPIPRPLRQEMRGTTWKAGCPVRLSDLRLLRFNYNGFDGQVKRGPMVIHEDVATDVLWVFGQLFKAEFPIKRVALTKEFVPEEFEPRISSRRSVTASFNCRPVVTPLGPGEDFSQHAYGLAVDINPVQNPYVTADGFVRNRMARPYLDRGEELTGMIHDGDVVVRSFAAIGWSWGGHWSGGKDYMHFSRIGS